MSNKGHEIVLNGFGSAETIATAMDECRQLGAPKVEHHGADLSKPNEIEDLFKFISERFGRSPDILVNNAGVFGGMHACTLLPSFYRQITSYEKDGAVSGVGPAARTATEYKIVVTGLIGVHSMHGRWFL